MRFLDEMRRSISRNARENRRKEKKEELGLRIREIQRALEEAKQKKPTQDEWNALEKRATELVEDTEKLSSAGEGSSGEEATIPVLRLRGGGLSDEEMRDEEEEEEEDEDMGVRTVTVEEGEKGKGTSSSSAGNWSDNPEAVRLRGPRLTPKEQCAKLEILQDREMRKLVEIDMEIMDLEKVHDRHKKINDEVTQRIGLLERVASRTKEQEILMRESEEIDKEGRRRIKKGCDRLEEIKEKRRKKDQEVELIAREVQALKRVVREAKENPHRARR